MRRFLVRTAAGIAIAAAGLSITAVTASPAGAHHIRMSEVLVSSVTVGGPAAPGAGLDLSLNGGGTETNFAILLSGGSSR